jgi:hypothetical protein
LFLRLFLAFAFAVAVAVAVEVAVAFEVADAPCFFPSCFIPEGDLLLLLVFRLPVLFTHQPVSSWSAVEGPAFCFCLILDQPLTYGCPIFGAFFCA